jgi:hypothetical protein
MAYKKKAEAIGREKLKYIDECLQREKRKKRKIGKVELRERLMKELSKNE